MERKGRIAGKERTENGRKERKPLIAEKKGRKEGKERKDSRQGENRE